MAIYRLSDAGRLPFSNYKIFFSILLDVMGKTILSITIKGNANDARSGVHPHHRRKLGNK
jgi:hypothetical protein